MNWYTSESTVRPKELDLDISPTTVYFRRNIHTETRQDEGGEAYTIFVYEEATLPKAEYAAHLAAQNQANIDFIAMMTDVELEG
jgi:hypothetical protein